MDAAYEAVVSPTASPSSSSTSHRPRVVVEAVPGAGKTHFLKRLCGDGVPCLVMAYNTQLAADVEAFLLAHGYEETATCSTFHALCGRCLAPARDDAQLAQAVARAERGELVPRDVPRVRRLLLDEAQDVREVYARLLRVLGLTSEDKEIVVVGDRHQLVYDFDPDFPGSLATLLDPYKTVAPGEWTRFHANVSHRLTKPMAQLVNHVFGTSIQAVKDGPKVEVRAPKSAFALADLLQDLFVAKTESTSSSSPLLLLVDRKQGNKPLHALLNTVSRNGHTVHVHGVDASITSTSSTSPPPSVLCTTFWSAKGLQSDTVVVLLPARAARHPLYVALTRATRRLVLVLDPKESHAAVCHAACDLVGESVLLANAAARAAVQSGGREDASLSLTAPDRGGEDGRTTTHSPRNNLDRHVPRSSVLRTHARLREVETGNEDDEDATATDGALVVATCLVALEAAHTGRVRAMEDLLHPTRLDPSMREAAVHAGFAGRAVFSRFVTDDALLADDLRAKATTAYRSLLLWDGETSASSSDATTVALATLAWDSFDHVMRQRLTSEVPRATERALTWLRERVLVQSSSSSCPSSSSPSPPLEWDVRLTDGTRHARVHATHADGCYHVVWGRTSADEGMAAVRAALHPKGTCTLLDLATQTAIEVCVEEAQAMWAA